MSKPTTVRFDDDEARELERLAKRRGTTVSNMVREAVRTYCFRKDHRERVRSLLEYIDSHPIDIPESPDEIDDRTSRNFGDAAR